MKEVYILACASMSPVGRILRAALRNVAREKNIKQIPFTPAIAGYKKFQDMIKSIDQDRLLVIDGCDNSCSLQFVSQAGIRPRIATNVGKCAHVTPENIKKAESLLKKSLKELGE